MSEKIVVGVTDAPVSRRVVEWAAQRAVDRRQDLVLLSVVGGAVGAVGEGEVVNAALEDAREIAEGFAGPLEERGIVVETRVERGNPVAALLEASESAALLVIGSDYRGPGTGKERGAHGIRVASAAHCPVAVVPDIDIDGRVGVVVGVDGSPISSRAVDFAAAEADRLREPLIPVSVWTPLHAPRNMGIYPDQYLSNMQAITEQTLGLAIAGLRQDYPDLEIRPRVERGYPSAVINDIAETARMTVMGSRGRGPVARFLLGSISTEVLQRLATVTVIAR